MMEKISNESDFISRPNKSFVSSSKHAFQENCIKQLSAPAERLQNKTYYIYLLTLKLHLFSSNSVKFDLTGSFNKRTARP